MNFIQIFKNYLFSSNFNLINPSYRFSPIFYKRFFIDLFLRLLIFLPFIIFVLFIINNGYFKEHAEIMFQFGQNLYGYLIVIFFYIPVFLLFVASLIVSLFGSILKRTVFISVVDTEENSLIAQTYQKAFLNSWKNLWYITLETFVLIFLSKIIIEIYAVNTISFSLFTFLKTVLFTMITSAIIASLISLPFIKFKKNKSTLNFNNKLTN
jgi:hypothetical protein